MTPHERVLGFTNRWYGAALASARSHVLPDGTDILVAIAPVFLATKVEAFLGRGDGDFWASKDLEDVVTLVNGRPQLAREVAETDEDLRRYLSKTLSKWLSDGDFGLVVAAHLEGDEESQQRAAVVLERLRSIAGSA